MKQKILKGIILCSSALLIWSCSKSEVSPLHTSKNNTQKFDFRTDKGFQELFKSNHDAAITSKSFEMSDIIKMVQIENESSRRAAYNLLDIEGRLLFWNYVIEYNIEIGEFSESQRSLLNELKTSLVTEEFFSNNDLQEILGAEYLPLIADQLHEAGITNDWINRIFSGGTTLNRTIPGGGKIPDCACNSGSRFSCSGCKGTDQCYESIDCGFLWAFSCNGLCPGAVVFNPQSS